MVGVIFSVKLKNSYVKLGKTLMVYRVLLFLKDVNIKIV